jgi:hypothetical protein
MADEKELPKLSALILAGPSKSVEPNEKEQGREDQLQAFTDFSNADLPMSERMDALAFFVDITREGGPTELDDTEE